MRHNSMMRTVFTADDLSEKCLVKNQQRMPCEGTVCSWSVQTGRPILTALATAVLRAWCNAGSPATRDIQDRAFHGPEARP